MFGLAGVKGVVAAGADADLVVYDPARKHTISASTHHMNWLGRVEEKAGATADQVAKPPSTRISNRQRRRAAKATPRTKQQVPTA